MDISQVKILRSRRRTAAIQITPQGEVVFRAPLTMPRREIARILTERRDWIERKLSAVRENMAAGRAAPLSLAVGHEAGDIDGKGSASAIGTSLCRPDGGDLWQNHHPLPADPVGKLLVKGKSEL